MLSRKNSIYEKILSELGHRKYSLHNLIPELLGLTHFASYKRQTIANAIQKLKKDQLIRVGTDAVIVSSKGQKYIEKKMARLQFFESPFEKNASKDLLVLFDIPEDRKSEREWFRLHLRSFGYEMIQKSVWLGPSPLPKQFLEYAKSIKLDGCIKMFHVTRSVVGNLKLKK